MSAELVQTPNHVLARSPGAWETAMTPVANVRVREVLGKSFSAEMKMFQLPRTALFRVFLPSTRVVVPDGCDFVGVTLVSRGHLRVAHARGDSQWSPGTALAVNHQAHAFDFQGDEALDATGICFRKPLLEAYATKFHDAEAKPWDHAGHGLGLQSARGQCFLRYANFIWDELERGGAFLESSVATAEIEDSLWALLLSAMQPPASKRTSSSGGYATYVRPAEEFIRAHLNQPLRVAEIAAAVGVSVPTLNRAFQKCHGRGPQSFAKQLRLEAARGLLLAADRHEVTVTEIATQFGFWHLSQFAADYRRAFYESPSETLRRD